MISFILNNELIQTDKPEGTALLDFIRDDADLAGTKIGCREGDCGACTVLEGTLENGQVKYKSIVSCLTPLGNAHGKHIVTLEGINMDKLSPVQQAMVDNAATQCGFCTPGFIMSFTGHAMSHNQPDVKHAIDAVSGNICRCTGYKSIERAAQTITEAISDKNLEEPVKWLVEQHYLPRYFLSIPEKLQKIDALVVEYDPCKVVMGGGTDLMVQQHDKIAGSGLNQFYLKKELKNIEPDGNSIRIGSACTANDIAQNDLIKKQIPKIRDFFKLISSEPIRNAGTVAGNIMNASPIGDLTIFLLALDAQITLHNGNKKRSLPLKEFFLDYKQTAIKKGEYIDSVSFEVPANGFRFNYEKVSKRTHLDIASVTSAIKVEVKNNKITNCSISAGGVKAIPLFLEKTSTFLVGKEVNSATIHKANEVLQSEISPISDVRGTGDYKRLLLRQLLFGHFMEMFPEKIAGEELLG